MTKDLKVSLDALNKTLFMFHGFLQTFADQGQIQFKNSNFKQQLLYQANYAYNRFILCFFSQNLESASGVDKDHQEVAYLFWRILVAHEAFYREFSRALSEAPQLILDGLKDLPNHFKPVKDCLVSFVPSPEAYPEKPEDASKINQYLVSQMSEVNEKGAFHPALDLFSSSMPKYRKYAMLLGKTCFKVESEQMFQLVYAPKPGSANLCKANAEFLEKFKSEMTQTLFGGTLASASDEGCGSRCSKDR